MALPTRSTRAVTRASWLASGLRKLVAICTVVQGRNAPKWLISASYATAQVSNKIQIQTDSGATQYGKYKFNPSTWMLTVGRKF